MIEGDREQMIVLGSVPPTNEERAADQRGLGRGGRRPATTAL
jgi:hypothetical protein